MGACLSSTYFVNFLHLFHSEAALASVAYDGLVIGGLCSEASAQFHLEVCIRVGNMTLRFLELSSFSYSMQ